MRELPPDCRSDLRHFFCRPLTVEPRHKRGMQAGRNWLSTGWNARGGVLRLAGGLCFQHRLGHFLHEKWDTVGTLNDVLSDTLWQCLVARHPVNHRSDFALAEAIKSERGDIGPPNQRCFK